MNDKKIILGTGSVEDAANEFLDAWRLVEQGHASRAPIEKISFSDQRLLFKTLTPKRFEIMEHVHKSGKISIRALAKALDRDYSNVHQDVKLLYQLGLMQKDEKDDKYSVPWDVIVTEITLSVAKNTKTIQRQTNHNMPRVVNG